MLWRNAVASGVQVRRRSNVAHNSCVDSVSVGCARFVRVREQGVESCRCGKNIVCHAGRRNWRQKSAETVLVALPARLGTVLAENLRNTPFLSWRIKRRSAVSCSVTGNVVAKKWKGLTKRRLGASELGPVFVIAGVRAGRVANEPRSRGVVALREFSCGEQKQGSWHTKMTIPGLW